MEYWVLMYENGTFYKQTEYHQNNVRMSSPLNASHFSSKEYATKFGEYLMGLKHEIHIVKPMKVTLILSEE